MLPLTRCAFSSYNWCHCSINWDGSSCWAAVVCIVPQRSTLGPLLFLSYAYDLQYYRQHITPNFFEDDTKLLYKSIFLLNVNSEIVDISPWFAENRFFSNFFQFLVIFCFPSGCVNDDVKLQFNILQQRNGEFAISSKLIKKPKTNLGLIVLSKTYSKSDSDFILK